MERLMHRARTLFRQNPLLAGIGAVVLLVVAGSLLVRLVFLLLLLAVPVVAGILIGWHLRSQPARLTPFFQWRDRVLDTLFTTLETALRWVERQLDGFRTGKTAPGERAVDPYRDQPRHH